MHEVSFAETFTDFGPILYKNYNMQQKEPPKKSFKSVYLFLQNADL